MEMIKSKELSNRIINLPSSSHLVDNLESRKKILVVTTSRADYGLLKNLLIQIRNDINLELDLVVSGTLIKLLWEYI